MADEAFEARKAQLKDDGKAGRWFSPWSCSRRHVGEEDEARDARRGIWATEFGGADTLQHLAISGPLGTCQPA